jgi:hypothetical protein
MAGKYICHGMQISPRLAGNDAPANGAVDALRGVPVPVHGESWLILWKKLGESHVLLKDGLRDCSITSRVVVFRPFLSDRRRHVTNSSTSTHDRRESISYCEVKCQLEQSHGAGSEPEPLYDSSV